MQKRKYTHLKAVEGLILSMRQDGMTFREIADELGLSYKQLRNWSYRHNCEGRNLLKGIAPKPIDPVTTANELGHADANTTQAIYAHQIARARAEASGVRAGVFSILKEA